METVFTRERRALPCPQSQLQPPSQTRRSRTHSPLPRWDTIRDPELRFGAEKGTPFTSFGLAVNTPKVPGEWSGEQRTDFYDVGVFFGTLGWSTPPSRYERVPGCW